MITCSPILTQPSTCRSLRSSQDPLSSLPQLLLARTSRLHQRLLQIMHYLFPCQTHVPQTIWTSQATSDSQEAVELNFHGFHRETPSVLRLHLHTGYC